MARYSRYGNHGLKPFPEYSILSNNWLIIYEAISKGRAGNDHLADLVNFSPSITLKCLISEKMIPRPLHCVTGEVLTHDMMYTGFYF